MATNDLNVTVVYMLGALVVSQHGLYMLKGATRNGARRRSDRQIPYRPVGARRAFTADDTHGSAQAATLTPLNTLRKPHNQSWQTDSHNIATSYRVYKT